jgi:dTDP-4-dehydrorhamnose reductase
MMRILLLGCNGQLGWELHRTLSICGNLIALDFPDIDFTRLSDLEKLVLDLKPTLIVNAAAYNNMDKAETEPTKARQVNAEAPGLLADLSRRMRAPLIHFSTDNVYDGTKREPYLETDTPNPVNTYGSTKLDGDKYILQVGEAFLILRTGWLYSLRQGSFVSKILSRAHRQPVVKVATDEVGSPTWVRMLAQITSQLVTRASYRPMSWFTSRCGIYHVAGSGIASRYDWAQAILALAPQNPAARLQPTSASETASQTLRPAYTALDCSLFSRKFRTHLPHWKESLALCLRSQSNKLN